MKTWPIALLLSLLPAPAIAAPLWECPYSNFLIDNSGRCINLDYMIQRRRPPAQPRHPFPEWLITIDNSQNDILQEKITFELDLGGGVFLSGFENRWALISTYFEGTIKARNLAEMGFIDCWTGWRGTYELPIGSTDTTEGINKFIPPAENPNPDRSRRTCTNAQISPRF